VTSTVFDMQPADEKVMLPFCFFTVTANPTVAVPLTLWEAGVT